MLGQFAKTTLTLSSLAPLCITWAFADWRSDEHGDACLRLWLCVVAVFLALLCWLVLVGVNRRIDKQAFTINTLKQADSEIVAFLVAYLLPLGSTVSGAFDTWVLGYGALILFVIVSTSHAYSFNPLMNLFGYHFYDVSNVHGVSYLLITRRTLTSAQQITHVRHMTTYLVMDAQ